MKNTRIVFRKKDSSYVENYILENTVIRIGK